jgi:hypothetical protein
MPFHTIREARKPEKVRDEAVVKQRLLGPKTDEKKTRRSNEGRAFEQRLLGPTRLPRNTISIPKKPQSSAVSYVSAPEPRANVTMLQREPMLQMSALKVAHLRGHPQHPRLTPRTTSAMLQMEPMLQIAVHNLVHLRGQQNDRLPPWSSSLLETGSIDAVTASVAMCLQEAKDLLYHAMEGPQAQLLVESHRAVDPAAQVQVEAAPGVKAHDDRSAGVPDAKASAKSGGCAFLWQEEGDAKRWGKEHQAAIDTAEKKHNSTAAVVAEASLLEGLLSQLKTAVMRLEWVIGGPGLKPRLQRDQGRHESELSASQRSLKLTRGLVQLVEQEVVAYRRALLGGALA